MAGVGLYGERHVVQCGEIKKQRRDLERARKPKGGRPINGQGGNIAPGKGDRAGIGRELARKLSDQRGLAGSVRTDDGVQLALSHVELDVVRSDNALEALEQPLDFKQRVRHRASYGAGVASGLPFST